MGYRPSINGVKNEFARNTLKPNVGNFEIIILIPESVYLDTLKVSLACFNPDLIPMFISRFKDRFRYDDLNSCELEKPFNVSNYEYACKMLGVSKKAYIKQICLNVIGSVIDVEEI